MPDTLEIALKILGGALTIGVTGWLFRRARATAEREGFTDSYVLRYAAPFRWLFVLVAVLCTGILVAALLYDPPETDEDRAVMFGTFGFLLSIGVGGLLETLLVRVSASGWGIVATSPWRGGRRLAWHQIEQITFSPSMMWFVVTGSDGTRIRISKLLNGVPFLGELVREKVDWAAYESADPFFDAPVFG